MINTLYPKSNQTLPLPLPPTKKEKGKRQKRVPRRELFKLKVYSEVKDTNSNLKSSMRPGSHIS